MSLFQRAIGIRLYPQSVYRRSFARMAEWKGFFATHARGAPEKRIHSLVRVACKNLGEPKARSKAVTNASKLLQGATGHAVVWAKHLRLLARPPRARLLARLYVKAPPLGDA